MAAVKALPVSSELVSKTSTARAVHNKTGSTPLNGPNGNKKKLNKDVENVIKDLYHQKYNLNNDLEAP